MFKKFQSDVYKAMQKTVYNKKPITIAYNDTFSSYFNLIILDSIICCFIPKEQCLLSLQNSINANYLNNDSARAFIEQSTNDCESLSPTIQYRMWNDLQLKVFTNRNGEKIYINSKLLDYFSENGKYECIFKQNNHPLSMIYVYHLNELVGFLLPVFIKGE